MAALVLIACKCTRADAVEEWTAWYPTFVASLVADPVTAAAAWELSGGPPPGGPGPGHTHVTTLELTGDTAVSVASLDARIRECRQSGDIHPAHAEIRREAWTQHRARVTVGPTDHLDGLITAEVLCTDPGRESGWDVWYDEQHLPDMLATGAFVAGSRWRRHPLRPGGANHLTVYEVAGMDVDDAVARSAAAMPGIVAAGRKHECHTGGLTMALRAFR